MTSPSSISEVTNTTEQTTDSKNIVTVKTSTQFPKYVNQTVNLESPAQVGIPANITQIGTSASTAQFGTPASTAQVGTPASTAKVGTPVRTETSNKVKFEW